MRLLRGPTENSLVQADVADAFAFELTGGRQGSGAGDCVSQPRQLPRAVGPGADIELA